MSSGLKECTKSGNLKKASTVKLTEQVKIKDSISFKKIKPGFKKSGLLEYDDGDVESENTEKEHNVDDIKNNADEQTIFEHFNSDAEESSFDEFE